MISREEIQAFVDQVVERFRPSKVILFGSYAYGKPNADSDVDLMVVMRHRGSNLQAAGKIRLACPRKFAMDLIVQSPAKVRGRIKRGDVFMNEVISRGVVLYDGEYSRVG
jgi:predicted nucleotidyltransferase